MRKIKCFLLIFSIMTALLSPLTVHAEKTIYKVGILNDYKYSGNNISSYAQDSVNSMFSRSENSAVEYSEYTFSSCIHAINADKIDFVSMVPKTDKLSAYFDFTDEPIAVGFLALFTKQDSDIYFEDFKNFNGLRIGMLRDSYFEEKLLEYSADCGFNYNTVYFNDAEELAASLESGKADAIFAPTTIRPQGTRVIAKCGYFRYHCAVRKGNTKMLDMLNDTLALQKENDPFYLPNLFQDNFKLPYYSAAALTEDEYLALKNQQKLRVLVPDDNYPMAYYDIEKGEYSGVYIDILRRITDNAGIELVFVPDDQKDMTMESITMAKADAILTVSGSKQGLIEATNPYTSISYMPIGKNDKVVFEDNSNAVGILSGDAWIEDYLTSTHPQWTITQYDSIHALFGAIERDKVDMALVSSPDMQTKTSLIAHPHLSIIQDFGISIPVSLGISKLTCTQHVVNLLNKIIQSVAVSESEFESKVYTLSHIYVPNLRDMIYANKIWMILILLLFLAIIAFIKSREKYFKHLAETDSLTHIHNMQYFNKTAEKLLTKNQNTPYLLASIDARNFKLINDRFGTIIGDQTIIKMADEISRIFKDNSVFARLQGDTFLVLCEDNADSKRKFYELEKLDIHIHNSTKYQVYIKTGICPIPSFNPNTPLTIYIDRANIAKDEAGNVNSNSVNYFTSEMASQLDTQNNIEIEMGPALQRGDFVVYYQPKYELNDDKIIGAEALVRWNHKNKGIISPGLFVPLFEKNGFIVNLDFYVYESVCKMLRSRIVQEKPIVPVSMNVSRCHLGDHTFVERLENLLKKYGIPKRYIEMEITESIFSQEDSSAIELVHNLKEHGFAISMDDFGSGYSSLNLLRKMPIDTLKIDKAFIDNYNSDKSQVIVEEVITMSQKINVKTICEGVETKEQRDFLKASGCDMVQGYFYARPMPSDDFEELLNSVK